MAAITRAELLALTPYRYLSDGYVDADGNPRAALLSLYATAASTQFLAAELSPQELELTAEAVRQILALQSGDATARARATAEEALIVVARAIQQPNNKALAEWLIECMVPIRSDRDLAAFLAHLLAVQRQYGVIATLSQQSSQASS